MAEYTKDSGIGDRIWNASKAFIHNGIKGAAGGAVIGALTFAAAAYLFPGVAAGVLFFGMTGVTGALGAGASIGGAIVGSFAAAFGALNEIVKPPVDTPAILPPEKARVISRAEAQALEPAIEIEGASPAFADRITQERLRLQQQSHTIH